MKRLGFLLLMLVLVAASYSRAEVVVTSVAMPGLPGFKTVLVTATSTVPGELIHVVDFIGDPDNNDPATARGFFGAMNQQQISGMNTVFDINFFPLIPPRDPSQLDSHFLVGSFGDSGINILIPAGHSKESATSLRAIYAGDIALGQSINLAHLVIPDAAAGTIHFRGSFAIARGGTLEDTPDVVGFINTIPEPTAAALASLAIVAIFGSVCRNRRLR